MHVAINRVHPETLKVHSPWKDYKVLETACRAMERKHGLQVDLGRTDYVDYGKFRDVVSPAARNFEASTWRQSFQSHVLDDKERIVKTAGKARDWQDLHKGIAKLDLEIVPQGRGLVLKQTGGREAVKASLVDRSLSHNELKNRLGPFEPAASKAKPGSRYRGRPLGRHPGVSRLWRTFLGQRKRPKTLLGRVAADWKQFLMNEAYRDPMALVVIIAYKEMFLSVFGEGAARTPRILRPALRHWVAAGKWADGTSGLGKKGKTRGLGLKEDGDGNLLIPFRDKNGHVWGLQVLKPDGKTTEIGDLGRKGLLHVIDPGRRIEKAKIPPAVVLTNDLSSAAAIRGASRVPVALLPPDGNMKTAVKSLRAQRPDCNVVVAGGASFVQRARAAGIDVVEIKESEHDRPVPDALKPNGLRAKLAPLVGDKGFMAWMELKDAPWANPGNAPWLMKNDVRGFGLKLAPDGGVAMPLKDVNGRLYDVKLVSPDGSSRRAAPDTETPPLMHLIDPGRRAREDAIIVAGDYLSGAAIHRATRSPVAVAEEPEKTMDVARALRERHPDSKLVIAADREQAQSLKETAGEIRAALATPPGKTKSFARMADEPDAIRDVLARPAGDLSSPHT